MTEGAGLGRYLKEAFLFRWNLLLFGTGALGAVLSGREDILLPALVALELIYLVLFVGMDRFRSMVDAQVHAEGAAANAAVEQAARQSQAEQLFRSLMPHRADRLARLRQRCLDMRTLAQGVSGGSAPRDDSEVSVPALDRLLWVFLKLLVSQQALERFLGSTDPSQIAQQLQGFKDKLAAAPETDDRLRRALTDSIATVELRLSNYQRAQSNAQFVGVELDRLEAKIQALTETSIGHEDPDYISSQVNSIAQSMAETEAEMRELDELTGIIADDAAPEILRPPQRVG